MESKTTWNTLNTFLKNLGFAMDESDAKSGFSQADQRELLRVSKRARLIAIRAAVAHVRADLDASDLIRIAVLLGADPDELRVALGRSRSYMEGVLGQTDDDL